MTIDTLNLITKAATGGEFTSLAQSDEDTATNRANAVAARNQRIDNAARAAPGVRFGANRTFAARATKVGNGAEAAVYISQNDGR